MKRRYSVLLAIALCLALIAGCGGPNPADGTEAPAAANTQGPEAASPKADPAETPAGEERLFALGEVYLNEEYDKRAIRYGGFPHMDGSEMLAPLAESFARKWLTAEGTSDHEHLTDFSDKEIAMEMFLRGEETSFLPYDDENDIFLDLSPLNLLLLADYNAQDEAYLSGGGNEIKAVEFARNAISLITHPDNPVNDLTKEQARGILAGDITDWAEVGGNPGEIKLYYTFGLMAGEMNSVLSAKLLEGGNLGPNVKEEQRMPSGAGEGEPYIVEYDARYENAPESIGIVCYTQVRGVEEMKQIAIDGIEPDEDTIRTNAYALVFGGFAVYRQADDAGAPGDFARWIMTDEGQALVEETGLVPVQ